MSAVNDFLMFISNFSQTIPLLVPGVVIEPLHYPLAMPASVAESASQVAKRRLKGTYRWRLNKQIPNHPMCVSYEFYSDLHSLRFHFCSFGAIWHVLWSYKRSWNMYYFISLTWTRFTVCLFVSLFLSRILNAVECVHSPSCIPCC